MKHILYISFYFILVNLLIFHINGKIIKNSEKDEIIKSNLRSGSSNSWNRINEEKHEKKHVLSHNSYEKTKNNENNKFFDKDKELSMSNVKNVSQTNFKSLLRNLGVSENIFLKENKLNKEGKLIEHIINDDDDKKKYIKGQDENRQEDLEEKAAKEKKADTKKNLERKKEHGDVLAEDLYGRLEIPAIELPSENERGYYIPHQSSLPQDNRGNSRDSKEISIIEKTNRESITTNVEGRRDIHKGHLEEKKDGSIKPEQKEDKSADIQNHTLETVNISDVNDFQISKYEDEISAEYDDSLIDEEEDDEDLDEFKPIVQYDNFQDEENIGIYKELEDLIEKNENLDDLDEGIEKSSEELSEEKIKKGKKYEKTKDNNFKPNDKSLYDEHIKKYKNDKQVNKEKEKFIKSLFHIFDGDNEILQIVDELSEDITKYFMKL
ncbi:hypothetical protein PFNF135_03217 [Plasmodium falciparum NF135/5.C10]|uniref:Liver stage-specific antigen 1 n=1 Tax=Plasmodium falciparum NF135/5.C10 TaxID=1036726 RepID=W4IFR6_PLAFA|nr:hypothetical protein PFNF135_03217 [Plasmodium falciparum NF135/5.C10]